MEEEFANIALKKEQNKIDLVTLGIVSEKIRRASFLSKIIGKSDPDVDIREGSFYIDKIEEGNENRNESSDSNDGRVQGKVDDNLLNNVKIVETVKEKEEEEIMNNRAIENEREKGGGGEGVKEKEGDIRNEEGAKGDNNGGDKEEGEEEYGDDEDFCDD